MANLSDNTDTVLQDGYAPVDLAGKPVDLSIFEKSKGCGVCHPGGGPFEYAFDGSRHDERALAGGDPDWPVDNGWDYKSDHTPAPWDTKGVLENDCLMCHLDGYNHLARNMTVKKDANFKLAPTMGSGLAASNGDGTFSYDMNQLSVVNGDTLAISAQTMLNIKPQPEDANCGFCHMPSQPGGGPDAGPGFLNTPPVPNPEGGANLLNGGPKSDWAKRGFFWDGTQSADVHAGVGCKGCHLGLNSTADKGKCNPGKGSDPLGSVDNASDHTVTYCQGCHTDKDANNTFGAPDPTLAHQAANVSTAIANGQAHTDFINCVTCHVKKQKVGAVRAFDFVSGGKYPTWSGSGPGPGGFDPAHTWKVDPADGKHKLYPFNYMTALIWNNVGDADVNADGENGVVAAGLGGYDPVFQGKYAKPLFDYSGVNGKGEPIPIGLKSGAVTFAKKGPKGNVMPTTAAEVEAVAAEVEQMIIDDVKIAGTPEVEMTLASEPFSVLHNVVDTDTFALGAGGCADCHGGDFFTGDYDMVGNDSTGAPITIYNGATTNLVAHAGMHNKDGSKGSVHYDSDGEQTRVVKRYETMGYDAARAAELDAINGDLIGVGATVSVSNPVVTNGSVFRTIGNRLYIRRSGATATFTFTAGADDDANFDGVVEAMTLDASNTSVSGIANPSFAVNGTDADLADISGSVSRGVKYVYVTVTDAEGLKTKKLAYLLYVY